MKTEPEYIPDFLKPKPVQIFSVSQDYFSHFAERLEVNMESKILSEIQGLNHNPFKVPQAYFEQNAMHLTQLTVLKKESHHVPPEYFDTLSSNILKRIEIQNKPVVKKSIFNRTWIYSVAAMLVLSVSLFLIQINKHNSTELNLNVIEEDALLDYVYENASDEDAINLMETMNTNDLNLLKLDESLNDESIDELIQEYQ
ncbi:MAG: hypothetical protein LKG19_14395 [Saprospiraceae bacterium]|jgi:hypothetical protein|nr:hypothetical protein [Saprospiraceae bacterium]